MLVLLPLGYFMEKEPPGFWSKSDSNEPLKKIRQIVGPDFTLEQWVQLRDTEAFSSEERHEIARLLNQVEDDPFPNYSDTERGEVAEALSEMMDLLMKQHLQEFLDRLEYLADTIKWPLYQEIERAGGDLVSLVRAIDLFTIQRQRIPIIKALSQLAEMTITKGARSPYLTEQEIVEMEQELKELEQEEDDG